MRLLLYKFTQAFIQVSILAGILTLSLAGQCRAQNNTTVYAADLSGPVGIEIDARGWIWVAEQGTGNDDSQVSVVTAENEVHPFITGLPSGMNATGEVTGSNHVYFNANGELLIVQGEGTDSLSQAVLVVDTTGFVPGIPALGRDAIKVIYKLGDFVLDEQGFAESNPFTLAYGPNDDLFIVDAAANAIIRRENSTGNLSVFATFADVSNNTGIGPPFIDAVPTGIVYQDNLFYVGSLTGFPFPNGAASIYQVDLDGNVTAPQDNLTTVVDLTTNPDGKLVILQFAAFKPPPPFVPNSGAVLELADGQVDTLAAGINLPTSVRFKSASEIFVSVLTGQILRIESMPTSVTTPSSATPESFVLLQNYPNPFNPETRIRYELSKSGKTVLKVFNMTGQEIRTLVDENKPAGSHDIIWNGRDHRGRKVASGVYLYRLQVGEAFVQTRKMILMQ